MLAPRIIVSAKPHCTKLPYGSYRRYMCLPEQGSCEVALGLPGFTGLLQRPTIVFVCIVVVIIIVVGVVILLLAFL
jgi:hypothetical protein